MKRLIKKAEVNYIKFLEAILYDKSYYDEESIESVIRENPECVYNGTAYRVLFFDQETVKKARNEFLGEEYDLESINYEELANFIGHKLINVNGFYQSFAKSLKGLNFAKSTLYEDGIPLSIQCDVSGLDLEKLCSKLKDSGLEANVLSSFFGEYKAEEEVLVKFSDNNFKVHDAKGFVDSILNL